MKNSQPIQCDVGDRIECGGHFGTIKYAGPIEGMPATWLGIDWDDPTRGKHSGTVNGIQYFTSKHPKSGSFVRIEKVNVGKSAIDSIESRYGQPEDEQTVKINHQKKLLIQQTMNAPFLEMVGFDKIFSKQSNFATLKIVNLRNQNVKSAGPTAKLGAACPNVEELDISKNLFVSFLDVLQICKELPKLHWLNVSENLLTVPEIELEESYPNIRTLICGTMELTWDQVMWIIRIFPQVEEFRVPYNKIDNLSVIDGMFENLSLLDIEGNSIRSWLEVCNLGKLPKLNQLNLENTKIERIEFEGHELKIPLFKSLRKLCLVNNGISDWRSIGELNRLESLECLKISKNPITETDHKNTVHQIIIAKIATLKILNGVEIETGERRGAEYDYIKKYGLEWLKVKGTRHQSTFLQNHNRYLELIETHGEPEESELSVKPKMLKSSLIHLTLIHDDFSLQKKIPPTLTVQKLMLLVQKLFAMDERPKLEYISKEDSQIEISLVDEMKEIGVYSMEDGDTIIVRK